MKLTGAVPEGSDSGNNKGIAGLGVDLTMDEHTVAPGMLDGALDAAEIAASVIDQPDRWRGLW